MYLHPPHHFSRSAVFSGPSADSSADLASSSARILSLSSSLRRPNSLSAISFAYAARLPASGYGSDWKKPFSTRELHRVTSFFSLLTFLNGNPHSARRYLKNRPLLIHWSPGQIPFFFVSPQSFRSCRSYSAVPFQPGPKDRKVPVAFGQYEGYIASTSVWMS